MEDKIVGGRKGKWEEIEKWEGSSEYEEMVNGGKERKWQ